MTEEPRERSAAAAAAEKVRAIAEAAERSAAELEAAARDDAARIRADAGREAGARLARARQAASRLAERAGELERQVAAVGESVAALRADLEELRNASGGPTAGGEERVGAANAEPAEAPARPEAAVPRAAEAPPSPARPAPSPAAEVTASPAQPAPPPAAEVRPPATNQAPEGQPVSPGAVREGEPVARVGVGDEQDDVDEVIAEAEAAAARGPDVEVHDSEALGGAPPGAAGTEHAGAAAARTEGARVIALNMALRGTPREQTARYLAENFDLDDPDALLDDVYARAGG